MHEGGALLGQNDPYQVFLCRHTQKNLIWVNQCYIGNFVSLSHWFKPIQHLFLSHVCEAHPLYVGIAVKYGWIQQAFYSILL